MGINKIGELRSHHGLTQAQLASKVGISRQSLLAIEQGSQEPRVYVALALAQALGVGVEDLFTKAEQGSYKADISTNRVGIYRVCLAEIAGENVARESCTAGFGSPIAPADAVVRVSENGLDIEYGVNSKSMFIDGCDPILGLLANRANEGGTSFKVRWFYGSNRASVEKFNGGWTHCALVHGDEVEGSGAAKLNEDTVKSDLGSWELALCFLPGNPKGIKGLGDLARSDLKIASRELGSGVRSFLDAGFKELNLDIDSSDRYLVFQDHYQVAAAIGLGICDVGVVPLSLAKSHGLGFEPVGVHKSSLYFSPDGYQMATSGGFFDLLSSAPFSKELAAFGGYELVR